MKSNPNGLSHVREHLPLQQGLRPAPFPLLWLVRDNVREHLPLQQGLRLLFYGLCGLLGNVREHLPLQQGLRLFLG